MRLIKWIIILIVVVGVAYGGYWWWQHSSMQLGGPAAGQTTSDVEATGEAPLAQPTPDSSGNATYADATYGFSLTYPSAYKIAKVPAENGDSFLIQNDQATGMQLMVSPYDEGDTLTADRIKKDLPDMPMGNVHTVTLPGANIQAVAFNSSGGGFGDSIEVWFAHGGYLYQASTYAAQASFLEQVMGTFHF